MSGIIHIALVAVTDTTTTNEDTSVAIDVLANDSDLDGDTLSISSVDQTVYGTTIIANGKLTYTPNANYNGSDSFTYSFSDSNNATASSTVNTCSCN